MKITAYDGTSGALPPLTDKTFWLDVSAANQRVLMTFFVQSTNGTFFVDGNEGATVFFRPKDGTPDFAATDKLGTIKALTGF